jgi:hypothetical protein
METAMRARLFTGLIAAAALAALGQGAAAEAKCETKVQTCNDARLGPRPCMITICTDDKGAIVSTDVLVFKENVPATETGGTKGTKAPKVTAPRPGAAVVKQ